MSGLRERKKQRVRARIYEAARARFAEHGFAATRVDEIAEDAEVSPATFFNYFPSKRAVLQALAEETLRMMHVILAEELEQDTSTQEKLEHYFVLSARGVQKRQLLSRELLLEVMRTATPIGESGPDRIRIHETYRAVIRAGQQAGDVRGDLDEAFLAEMVFGSFAAIFTNWLNDPDYPIEERALQTARFIGAAIAAE